MNKVGRGQWLLIGLLLALLGLPFWIQAFLWLPWPPHIKKIRSYLRNGGLRGMVVDAPAPGLTIKTWFNGEFQSAAEERFNRRFFGREILIRSINQIYYTLFSKSYMDREHLVVGKNRVLYEDGYIQAYKNLGTPPDGAAMTALADRISELNDRLKARGICFCLVFTAGKASIDPADIPDAYRDRLPGARSNDSLLKERLGERGVPCVDGKEIVLRECIGAALPPFARGGTHWNALCAYRVGRALVERLASLSGDPLLVPDAERIDIVPAPTELDSDIYDLLNIWQSPDYASFMVRFPKGGRPAEPKESLALVGGSFGDTLMDGMVGSFSRIDRFYYYRQFTVVTPRGAEAGPTPIDFERDVLSNRFLVLELNESVFGQQRFYEEFIQDALEHLRQSPR